MSFRRYLFTMVFLKEDKIIIQNYYEEKKCSTYKIWKDHSSKTGFMNRKEGSGRPRSVATDLTEELIC